MREKEPKVQEISSVLINRGAKYYDSYAHNEIRKKRDCYEVMFSILKNCDGKKKTKLMYAANLNYGIFTKYLSKLEKLNYITLRGDEYYLTEKGREYITKYKEYIRCMTEFENIKKELDTLFVGKI
ncbi:winged helix-turn-helix domain-containing protein [Acidianus brierleyi]|uniref:ArnR1-like winged helix-turn-helix domain-containing protein n=1 Tax=Acidianus brierleyi TaxID=41673 RepID=A0A2U9IHK7_9CREN|nr:winged helix-turn-helix domain-containing protein [Acidianus brierleyi]AWR95491.1 hypothetical protein DFR85_13695 [Acidianus brierleyi]